MKKKLLTASLRCEPVLFKLYQAFIVVVSALCCIGLTMTVFRNVAIGIVPVLMSASAFFIYRHYLSLYFIRKNDLLDAMKNPAFPVPGKDEPAGSITNQTFAVFNDTLSRQTKFVNEVTFKINDIFNVVLKVFGLTSQMGCTSNDQFRITTQTLQQVNELIESILVVSGISERFKSTSVELSGQADTESRKVETILNQNKSTIQLIRDVLEHVHTLREDINKIQEVNGTVAHISRQTPLLSLNAAIASCQDTGNSNGRFSVIAGEIRSLSGKASEAVCTISRLIENTTQRFEHLNNSIRNSEETCQNNLKLSEGIRTGMAVFDQAVDDMSGMIVEITKMYMDNSKIANTISSVMTQMIESSTNTLNDSSQVDTAMTDLMTEIESLQKILSEFNLNPAVNERCIE